MKNELRLGNYINNYNKVIGIGQYLICEGLSFSGIVFIEDPKPIPLTEDILLKCGFKQEENVSWYNHSCISVSLNDAGNYVIFGNSGREITRKGIKFLHQLQNLYFALTNEELNINL